MATRGNDLSGKCGLAGGSLARGQGARTVVCSFFGSVLADIVIWSYGLGTFNFSVQAKVIKKQEESISSLKRELELARTEIGLLKGVLNLADNCSEEFRTVSNSQRNLKNFLLH
jgi:hypothetical protein